MLDRLARPGRSGSPRSVVSKHAQNAVGARWELLRADQSIRIDLPLKVLAWEEGAGQAWFAYNDLVWLIDCHDTGRLGTVPAAAMRSLLAAVTQGAAMP